MRALNMQFLMPRAAFWPHAFANAGPSASHTLPRPSIYPLIQQIILSSYYTPAVVQDADVIAVSETLCLWSLGIYSEVVRDTV